MPRRYEAPRIDPAPLGEPLILPFSKRVAPNRLMKAAMTERLADWDYGDRSACGIPNEALATLYGHWVRGGWGIVVTGNIIVDEDHIETPGNMIISASNPFSGPRFEAYRRLARAGKSSSSSSSSGRSGLFLGQLNHPGRQISRDLQPDPVSASDVQLEGEYMGLRFARPHAASADEIRSIQASFVHAATYLERAGFDGVQLHGAHGYLIAQFLSPTTNRRGAGDQYGGPLLEDRARFVTEIADGIRAATGPAFVLGIKINSVEFQDAGFTPADAAALVALLERHGFDFVELSGGTYEGPAWHHRRESTRRREAFFIEFAERIAPHARDMRCLITGGIRSVAGMVGALASGLDGVGLARPSATEPRLPREILRHGAEGCIRPILDDAQGLGMEAFLAGAQMRLISLDREPIDPSDQQSADAFVKDQRTWLAALADKEKSDVSRQVSIETIDTVPYKMVESDPV
ncbi:NADH oxidase [Xylariomycetidae sp. FL2044]|nr:NADH oxidase [Xylariomycetidae sp. FL2044]